MTQWQEQKTPLFECQDGAEQSDADRSGSRRYTVVWKSETLCLEAQTHKNGYCEHERQQSGEHCDQLQGLDVTGGNSSFDLQRQTFAG